MMRTTPTANNNSETDLRNSSVEEEAIMASTNNHVISDNTTTSSGSCCGNEPFSKLLAALELHQQQQSLNVATPVATTNSNGDCKGWSNDNTIDTNHSCNRREEPQHEVEVQTRAGEVFNLEDKVAVQNPNNGDDQQQCNNDTTSGPLSQLLSQAYQEHQHQQELNLRTPSLPLDRTIHPISTQCTSLSSSLIDSLHQNKQTLLHGQQSTSSSTINQQYLHPEQIVMELLGMYASDNNNNNTKSHDGRTTTSMKSQFGTDFGTVRHPVSELYDSSQKDSMIQQDKVSSGPSNVTADSSSSLTEEGTRKREDVCNEKVQRGGLKKPPPPSQDSDRSSGPLLLSDGSSRPPKAATVATTESTCVVADAPSVPQPRLLAETVTLPCSARGMPPDHNFRNAHFVIPPTVRHGQDLMCSYPTCRPVKFRYCAVCQLPVARRNFHSRHGHGLDVLAVQPPSMTVMPPPPPPSSIASLTDHSDLAAVAMKNLPRAVASPAGSSSIINHCQPPSESHSNATGGESSSASAAAAAGGTPTAAVARWDDDNNKGRKRKSTDTTDRETTKKMRRLDDNSDDRCINGSKNETTIKKKQKHHDRDRAVVDDGYVTVQEYPFLPTNDGISLARQLRWCIILGERPDDMDDAEAMSAWMSQVLAVSDLAKPLSASSGLNNNEEKRRREKRCKYQRRRKRRSRSQDHHHRHEHNRQQPEEKQQQHRQQSPTSRRRRHEMVEQPPSMGVQKRPRVDHHNGGEEQSDGGVNDSTSHAAVSSLRSWSSLSTTTD